MNPDPLKLSETDRKFGNIQVLKVKAAVEWLKTYLKHRKPGHKSIKIDILLKVIDEAFPDLKEVEDGRKS